MACLTAYYNEHDPQKAAVLRELIREGVIAPGDVDERSIKDVTAGDVRGYVQCHFFAGIGVWSYAARLAGWPDDRPMWSGSCPCPSFSAAGKGGGFDDPRHLWPDWGRLIGECRPAVVFGEQADDAIGYGWLDLVQTDLETQAYAVGKAVLGACSVGAPHIRQRCYFVAHPDGARSLPGSHRRLRCGEDGPGPRHGEPERPRDACGVGYSSGKGFQEFIASGTVYEPAVVPHARATAQRGGRAGGLDHADSNGQRARRRSNGGQPCGGFWTDAEWVPCRNPKVPGAIDWRAIEPGTFPLAHGAAARVLQLRCFGDAIVAPLAQAWIETFMDVAGVGPDA